MSAAASLTCGAMAGLVSLRVGFLRSSTSKLQGSGTWSPQFRGRQLRFPCLRDASPEYPLCRRGKRGRVCSCR
eukprot:364631-Chlamydomonas_euryale.AAC.29